MNNYVADTHSLIWYFTRPDRLGQGAISAFSEIASGQAILFVPIIVLAELVFAIENGRVQVDFDGLLHVLQAIPNVQIVDLGLKLVLEMPKLTAIPEMHDRLIVAEANARQAMLITQDQAITFSGAVITTW